MRVKIAPSLAGGIDAELMSVSETCLLPGDGADVEAAADEADEREAPVISRSVAIRGPM